MGTFKPTQKFFLDKQKPTPKSAELKTLKHHQRFVLSKRGPASQAHPGGPGQPGSVRQPLWKPVAEGGWGADEGDFGGSRKSLSVPVRKPVNHCPADMTVALGHDRPLLAGRAEPGSQLTRGGAGGRKEGTGDAKPADLGFHHR